MRIESEVLRREAEFLIANPDFTERPATLREFLGPDYLDIEAKVRPAIREVLAAIMGEDVSPTKPTQYEKAIFTGGIGIGKTTFASIVLAYVVHWCLCLRNPQEFFDLLPGSRIAFMEMSTSEGQAKEVVFGDIKARIQHSPWFKKYQPDKNFKNQLRFPKDIWIIPGDSAETTFEGYNILGGILDEADSHKLTKFKDYAAIGYECVDEQTTIFTADGWKRYDELCLGDDVLTLNHETGLAEWQPVEGVHVYPVEGEELMLMEGKEFSALTTGNHRWPIVTNKGSRLWKTTETLATGNNIPLCAPLANLPNEPKYSDALVEAVAWGWTEGHILQPGVRESLEIYQSSASPNVSRIRAALTAVFGVSSDRLGRPDGTPRWREYVNRGLTCFRLSADASEVVMRHMPGRVVTYEFLRSLTRAQLELFIQCSLLADNCGSDKLAQKNPAAAEAFAFACVLAGYGVSIRPVRDKWARERGVDYDMTLVRKLRKTQTSPKMAERAPGSAFRIEKVRHTGVVWCPRTANQTWLARRKGSVYFTGNTIYNRMSSRFGDRGFVLIIGQMKSSTGFAARKFEEFSNDPNAYAHRMTIWESRGWDYYRCKEVGPHKRNPDLHQGEPCEQVHTFYYDFTRKQIIPKGALTFYENAAVIEIPDLYRSQFELNPEKALKDLAGFPPVVGDPFISLTHKIHECRDAWIERYGPESPISTEGRLESWFHCRDTLRRVAHVDIGYAAGGDAAAIAMGHIPEMVNYDGERKPFIVIDCIMRFTAPSGGEIMLSDLRHFIYTLRDDRNFKLKLVTLDGFQSIDTIQQLRKRRFACDYLSVDKNVGPYHDLREAIYEGRLAFPPYAVHVLIQERREEVEIAIKELSELIDTGSKIDHPEHGSKDVADALAGVVFSLMGDRRYHSGRGAPSGHDSESPTNRQTDVGGFFHPAYLGGSANTPRSPVPPSLWSNYRP